MSESAIGPISGNKAVEDAAVAWVVARETLSGRQPRDRRYDRGFPGDIESSSRTIEVKAFGKTGRGGDLWLEVAQVEEARCNPEFYVYVVENISQGDPARFSCRQLYGERLARLLSRAKEQRYYTVPWPVGDYDSCEVERPT